MTNKEAIKMLQQLYPNGGHCWLDEQRIEAIGMAVKALQEEPVSEDLGKVGSLKSFEYYPEKKTTNKTSKGVFDANMPRRKAYLRGFKDGAHAHKELIANKPVSEDLEKAAEEYAYTNWASDDYHEGAAEGLPFDAIGHTEKCFKAGAKWQKDNLWKPADGDDLPKYDSEVVVLIQPYPLENSEYAVSFAHRPNPDGWDGKSISTGKVEHYTPKTYDKGGWNIPDIKFWLDVELPKEIEL